MQRYAHFQSLPPEQREKVLERYHRWQSMTPQQREEMRQRFRGHHWHEGGGPGPGKHPMP